MNHLALVLELATGVVPEVPADPPSDCGLLTDDAGSALTEFTEPDPPEWAAVLGLCEDSQAKTDSAKMKAKIDDFMSNVLLVA